MVLLYNITSARVGSTHLTFAGAYLSVANAPSHPQQITAVGFLRGEGLGRGHLEALPWFPWYCFIPST